MTNEQLALLIQKGGNDHLIPQLWNKVKKLLEMKALFYYGSFEELFRERGIEFEDLVQEMYFPFMKAIKYYNVNSQYKFVTYLEAPIRERIRYLICRKGTAIKRYVNIDRTVKSDGSLLLSETLEDAQIDVEKKILDKVTGELLMKEIDKLKSKRRSVIKGYYYSDLCDTALAKRLQTTPSNVYRIRYEALGDLRRSATVNGIYSVSRE